MTSFETRYAIPHGNDLLPAFPILMPDTWQRAPTQVCVPIVKGLSLRHVPLLAPVHFIGDPNGGTFQRAYVRTERLEAIGASDKTMPVTREVYAVAKGIPIEQASGPFVLTYRELPPAMRENLDSAYTRMMSDAANRANAVAKDDVHDIRRAQ